MTKVNKEQINEWGSNFSDRKNNFDDSPDVRMFIHHTLNDTTLQQYLLNYIPDGISCKWQYHPDDKYGIDVALVDETGKKHLLIDLERWKQWDNEWPAKYKYISFLARKSHFLEEPVPFLMVFMSNRLNKLLIVDKESIKKYRIEDKFFQKWGKTDKVRKVKFSEGNLFGTNITDIEKGMFKCHH
jgi:hypothetical protein|tara:strand:+ start:737 stop:1291 length:555 start_codon:yes stop_codon:yes gene_type:complete